MLATAVTATACADSRAPGPCIGSACGSQTTIKKVFQQGFNRKVDLLFVVDDTDAVAPWIENLRAGYPAMARLLENLPWGVPNLHVGFVRASRCASQTRARDCGIAAPEDFIRHEICGSVSNFTGSFADAFSCMAELGTQASCAVAQPFEALRDVLAAPPAGWETFVRPDAILHVVVIAGRDDPSSVSVAELATAVRALKSDPNFAVFSLIGPSDGCPPGGAAPRLTELVQQFGRNGLAIGLCHDPALALQRLAALLSWFIDPACLTSILDVDPAAPGLQADCAFEDTVYPPGGSPVTTALPSCDAASPPCWRMTEWPGQSSRSWTSTAAPAGATRR